MKFRSLSQRVATLACFTAVLLGCYDDSVDPPVRPKDESKIVRAPQPTTVPDPVNSSESTGTEPVNTPKSSGTDGNGEPIVAAAPQNPNDCDNLKVTYTANIAPMSQRRCNSCHRAGSTFPDLTSKAGWQSSIARSLRRIKGVGNLMPLGGPKLPEDQVAFVENWQTCGFP